MNLPREHVAHLPTKIDYLPQLTALLGGPRIFCKRDDQTGLGFGGNKTRKLEFLLADARAGGTKTLITTGAIQSNHCRQTAALAARCGFDCILVLTGEEPEIANGNLFLDHLFGAEIVWSNRERRDEVLEAVFIESQREGRKPYKIPYGASNSIGMQGYVEAMKEMKEQGISPDWIVLASSSGGTQAGMVLGTQLTKYPGQIIGISIDSTASDLVTIITRLVQEGMKVLGANIQIPKDGIIVNDEYLGGGYGVMGVGEVEAIRLFARHEGLLLDPVYTGRAAAGMIDLIRKGYFRPGEDVLFWHTGGTPALFADPYSLLLQQE